MPPGDLETLVSSRDGGGSGSGRGSDRKIACETLASTAADDGDQPTEVVEEQPDLPADFPPESFWLSKDAEYDWFDRNAFYDRKESMKANSHSTNLNPNLNSNPTSNPNSQRFSKASIIGLPKTQKASYVDSKKRRNSKAPNIRLFPPRRSESIGKSAVAEPSSPKVSCMGRVRSKRGRRKPVNEEAKSVEKARIGRRPGFCGFLAIFRSDRRSMSVGKVNEPVVVVVESVATPRKSVEVRKREWAAGSDEPEEAPGLGGMKRFASGRRSVSWGVDDVDGSAEGGGPTGRS